MKLKTEIPAGFAEEIRKVDGIDAEALLKALDTEASVAIRFNNRKAIAGMEDIYPDMRIVDWCRDGRYLDRRPVFTLNPLLHAGVFYVQDASSMIYQQIMERIIEKMGDKSTPVTLLDFCAAPGGKTTAMINALPDGSVVVANEFVPARGKVLRENLEKWGYPNLITTGAASADYSGLPEIFDIIAVDAPCSGEGMMRKDETARSQWSDELVNECATLQREILSDIAGALRPGGYLIYSTCTFNLREDELNSRYIRETLGLQPVAISELDLRGIDKAAAALLPGEESLRFMPHLTEGEGLYVSIFRKPGEFTPYLNDAPSGITHKSRQKARTKGKAKKDAEGLNEMQCKELQNWFDPSLEMNFELNGHLVTALPSNSIGALDTLRNNGVRITGAGLPAAELKGRDIIPDSRITLSSAANLEAFPTVDLSEEDAMKYLRRDTLSLPEGTPKGYVAVSYKKIPLGLMKNIGSRANNLFPSPWRVRINNT